MKGDLSRDCASLSRPASPPWLWIWAAALLSSLPGQTVSDLASVGALFANQGEAAGASPDPYWLLLLSQFLEDGAYWILVAGLLVAAVPWVRGAYVRRRYGLQPMDESLPVCREILAYVRALMPGTVLRVNLLRPNLLAFVYPVGFRKSEVAVFGGFVSLWRADRVAAEAVLLHESSHLRRGDSCIVGAGSLIEPFVRYAVFILLFFVAVLAVKLIGSEWSSHAEWAALKRSLPHLDGVPEMADQPWQLRLILTGLISQAAILALGFIKTLLSPLAALWALELTADRDVLDRQGGAVGLEWALGRCSTKAGAWRRLLLGLSHPPDRLRRALIRARGRLGLLALLLLVPVAELFRGGVAMAHYASSQLATPDRLPQVMQICLRGWCSAFPETCAIFSLVLLLWPWVFPSWEWFFTGRKPRVARDFGTYVAAAAIVGAFGGGAWLLGASLGL